jgi:hypothetical protein
MTGGLKREDIRLSLLVKVPDGSDGIVTLFHVTRAFVYVDRYGKAEKGGRRFQQD